MNSLVVEYHPDSLAATEAAAIAAFASGAECVVLDLDSIASLDASAVRGLIGLLRRAREHGGDVALRVGRPDILRTLSVTALDRIFKVVNTEAA
ncbi:MAG TPA: STAS domain-containing protein [Candidatus Baltobacteraceae bacterium]